MLTKREAEIQSVAEFVQSTADADPPMLFWGEPQPWCFDFTAESAKRQDFTPFGAGKPAWSDSIEIAEARLFWPDRSLHVVSDDAGGCFWSLVQECAEGQGPVVDCLERPVYTIQERRRFGLAAAPTDRKLFAVEYSMKGRIVAWRLVLGE